MMSKAVKVLIALMFCLSMAAASYAADKLALVCKYSNERYGYSFKYPDIFDKKVESDSGDGITLSSKDGKYKLLIWGGYNALFDTPAALLESSVKRAVEDGEKVISKQSDKDTCYVASYNEKKKSLSYHMTLANDDMIKAFLLTYPKSEEKQFEKVIKEMRSALKK